MVTYHFIILVMITTTIVTAIIIDIFRITTIIIVFVLQEGRGSPAGTSMESSGSNHAAPAGFKFHDSPSVQTAHAEQLLLLPSTTDPSSSVDADADQAAAIDEQQQPQKVAHLKVMR